MSTADLRGDGSTETDPPEREPWSDGAGRRTPTAPDARPPAAEPSGGGQAPAEPIRLSGARPSRRRAMVAGGVVAAAAVGIGAVVWRGGDEGSDAPESETVATATAEVTVRDLQERADLDGTLGYGETSELSLAAQGTITWLPAEGAVVQQGQSVAEVDDRVIPLLYGGRPLWRELGPGVDDGVDVELVERNLVELGVVTADGLTVDQEWTSATTDAVEEWQEAIGLEETGRIGLGDVVVRPGAVRVTGHLAEVGGQPGGPVLEVGGTTRQVTIDLDATQQSLVAVDQAVDIELPDGSTTTGKVSEIGTVAEAPEGAGDDPAADVTPTIEVTITLDDPAAAGTLDQAPVVVSVVTSAAQGVTAVPVDALLALAEGGYAVEKAGADGASELVAVEVGAFADGWVEVTGDLAEGDDVVVPA
jgi:Putative peptidoglycan binding domain/HlyD family secretion protein